MLNGLLITLSHSNMGLLRFMGENEPGNLLRGIIVHPDAHISRSWYRNRKVICAVHWVIVSDVIIYFYKASDIDAPENSYVRSAGIIRIIHLLLVKHLSMEKKISLMRVMHQNFSMLGLAGSFHNP